MTWLRTTKRPGDQLGVESFKCDKHDHYANESKSRKCYNCGNLDHNVKFYRAKKKSSRNLLTKEDEEEMGILLFSKNSNTFKTKLSEVVQEETKNLDVE